MTACLQTLKGVVFDVLFDEFLYVDRIVDKSTTFLRWFVPSLGAINVAVDQRILNTLFSFCLGQIKTLFEALKRSGGVALLWSKCRRIIPNFNYSWQVIRVKVNSKNLSSQKVLLQNAEANSKIQVFFVIVCKWKSESLELVLQRDIFGLYRRLFSLTIWSQVILVVLSDEFKGHFD